MTNKPQVTMTNKRFPEIIDYKKTPAHEEVYLVSDDLFTLIDALHWFIHQHEDHAKRLMSINWQSEVNENSPAPYECVLWFYPEEAAA